MNPGIAHSFEAVKNALVAAFQRAGKPGATVALAVAAFVAAAFVLFGDPFGKRATGGSIYVDSPEIYTRERLVNDRFVQDAWLTAQLQKSDGARDLVQTTLERRTAEVLLGGKATEAGATAPDAKTGEKVGAAQSPERSPVASTQLQLVIENDFRDAVRSLIIENQLDDGHDLNGNSLYMLKFDASILPGANTSYTGKISVRLSGPRLLSNLSPTRPLRAISDLGPKEQVETWVAIYSKWIDSLHSRLNQAHRELKHAYRNNEFSQNDYSRLIEFISRNLTISATDAVECRDRPPALRDKAREQLAVEHVNHEGRKSCVYALVRYAIKTGRYQQDAPLQSLAANDRPDSPTPVSPVLSSTELHEQMILRGVNTWLNAFLATRSVKIVLGIPLPESGFLDCGFRDLPALKGLVKVSVFTCNNDADDDVFTVLPRRYQIAAIEDRVTEDSFGKLLAIADELRDKDFALTLPGRNFASFREPGFKSTRKLRVYSDDLTMISDDDYVLVESDFRAPARSDGRHADGLLVANVDSGLLHFARKARMNTRAFTYSVTPKDRGDTIVSSLASDSRLQGAWGQDAGNARIRRELLGQSTTRRTAVVGFARPKLEDAPAEFGWMISPRQMAGDGQQMVRLQVPAQHSLSALVSLPAWWNEVNLEVTVSWVGPDGKPVGEDAGPAMKYTVDLPVDFEPLETMLLEVQQLGPEIMESRLDPVMLTSGREGAIVIPGRRLWRSTRVTLGYQVAEEITVLPNMKGIIAKFKCVENQASPAEKTDWESTHKRGIPLEVPRAVRVWTSQGAITLPSAARISGENECPRGSPKT